jgi:predicted nucleic acid-binding protein
VNTRSIAVVYWDTSALISVLFHDAHSVAAARIARKAGFHFLSTLAWAEAHAVIGRLAHDRISTGALLDTARDLLNVGPWRRVNVAPSWDVVGVLATKWPLRGADLWHLAAAKSLQTELPELAMLSFDSKLAAAAKGEGL